MAGQTTWNEIQAMLNKCAPGWTFKEGDHDWFIYFDTKRAVIPFGDHKKRGNREGRAEIQNGHVRKMARSLEIEQCIKDNFPSVFA